jgi:hypothetical protein
VDLVAPFRTTITHSATFFFVIPNSIWDPDAQRRDSCRDEALLDPDFHQDDGRGME